MCAQHNVGHVVGAPEACRECRRERTAGSRGVGTIVPTHRSHRTSPWSRASPLRPSCPSSLLGSSLDFSHLLFFPNTQKPPKLVLNTLTRANQRSPPVCGALVMAGRPVRFQPRDPVCATYPFSSLYGVPGPKPNPGVREMNWMLILALGTFQANRGGNHSPGRKW